MPGAGRSCLVNRLVTNTFLSLGRSKTDESSPIIDLGGVKVQLWCPMLDSHSAFDSIPQLKVTSTKASVDGIVGVYDVSDLESFQNFNYWITVRLIHIYYESSVPSTHLN